MSNRTQTNIVLAKHSIYRIKYNSLCFVSLTEEARNYSYVAQLVLNYTILLSLQVRISQHLYAGGGG